MKRPIIFLCASLLVTLGSSPLFAGMPIYMNYEGIKSEIRHMDYGGLSPRDVSTGQATGKRQYKPFVITKEYDKASPLLAKAAVKGELVPAVNIEFTKRDQQGREQTYMVITLHNVLISSVQTGTGGSSSGQTGASGSSSKRSRGASTSGEAMSSGGDRPMESLSLNFTKIEFKRLDGKTTMMDDWEAK